MLDGNKISDIKEISKYGKAKGYLLAKRYKLPTYSNFFIVENEDEIRALLDKYKGWIVNPFLDNFYKDTFLYSIGVK